MDDYKLKMFFCKLIGLMYTFPGRPGFGNPVSWLTEQMCMYQDKFLKRIVGDFTGDSHECRLNNAGLKMYWSVDRSNSEFPRFICRIGGDQAKYYPEFVEAANDLAHEYDFCKKDDRIRRWRNLK